MKTRDEIMETWETEGRDCDWFAIDSYDPVTAKTTRLFVGTEAEAWRLMTTTYSLPSETACSTFYRCSLIAPEDALRFFKGDATVMDERGEYSITEAAEILGVSRQRVHQMLQAGQLNGHKVGNAWAVYRYSVEGRL